MRDFSGSAGESSANSAPALAEGLTPVDDVSNYQPMIGVDHSDEPTAGPIKYNLRPRRKRDYKKLHKSGHDQIESGDSFNPLLPIIPYDDPSLAKHTWLTNMEEHVAQFAKNRGEDIKQLWKEGKELAVGYIKDFVKSKLKDNGFVDNETTNYFIDQINSPYADSSEPEPYHDPRQFTIDDDDEAVDYDFTNVSSGNESGRGSNTLIERLETIPLFIAAARAIRNYYLELQVIAEEDGYWEAAVTLAEDIALAAGEAEFGI